MPSRDDILVAKILYGTDLIAHYVAEYIGIATFPLQRTACPTFLT